MGLHAEEHVGEVGDGVDAVHLAGADERVEAGQVLAGVIRAHEEEVLSAEDESPFILPMSASARWCTTDGTRSSTPRSASRIASIVEEKTLSSSRRRTDPAPCCQRGCSTLVPARR